MLQYGDHEWRPTVALLLPSACKLHTLPSPQSPNLPSCFQYGDHEWRPQDRERLSARLAQPRFIASHSYDFGTTTTTLIIVSALICLNLGLIADGWVGVRLMMDRG